MEYKSIFHGINGAEKCENLGYPQGIKDTFGKDYPSDSILIRFTDGRMIVTSENLVTNDEKQHRAVMVKWIDSCGGDCYWSLLKDFKPQVTKPTTFGFVIHEDDECISVAQSLADAGGDNAQYNGVICIPKVSIIEIVDLPM